MAKKVLSLALAIMFVFSVSVTIFANPESFPPPPFGPDSDPPIVMEI